MNKSTLYHWARYRYEEIRAWFIPRAKVLNSFGMLLATSFAALATWNGYRATEDASATAQAAFDFSLRTAQDASELQRPVLTVLGGKITQEQTEDEGLQKTTKYLAEIHIRNTGTRDAKPGWIALGSNTSATWGSARQLDNIPKDQEVVVYFDIKVNGDSDSLDDSNTLAVGLRFVDTAPKYDLMPPHRGEVWSRQPTGFTKICDVPKIQFLTIHRIKTESGKHDIFLSMGRSVSVEQVQDKRHWDEGIAAAREALYAVSRVSMEVPECHPIPED